MALDANKLVIRPLRQEDFEEVVRIDSEYTGERREEYYKRLFNEILNAEHAIITSLAAEYDGKLVGFIAGTVFSGEFGIPENTAYITTMGVDKDFVRMGIGKELFKEFVRNVRAAGVTKIYTIVDWEENWDLLSFFRRAGFKPSATKIYLEMEVP
ncbi:GNAT family N-acetyltransferase [Ferroglobus sp.]|uniref:GNAT family N-acetyltransferase n=1 Tax=Ferroglobus sp. TaxID=2614230 RepID=UPI0025C38C5E|nr:GNAT family N-acetyltransferase [Ferroglobus sp.]